MTLTASPADHEELEPGLPEAGLLMLLRRAGSMIDAMWHSALADSGEFTAVQLAEASQGVHRALIALTALERAALGPTA